jgi:sphingosine kinase
MKNQSIFECQLAVYARKPTEIGILTDDILFWQDEGTKQQLKLNDVVGTSLIDGQKNDRFGLSIYAYPHRSGLRSKQRTFKEYRFTCSSAEARSQWQQAIDNTLMGKPIDAVVKQRHLQIIINPVSGKGLASQIFDRVRPLFDRSNLEYIVTKTFSATDTKELVRKLDLDKIDGLVIVGGDGTIHDAIAGLMSRRDKNRAIKIPLGIIPGGTANGLSKTLLELSNETYDPLNAAFLIAKGKQQTFDLAAIKQNGNKYYSFLSLAWGLISDVDIESEKLKFLGALRFDLYALLLVSLLRTYKGRFSFIPHPDCQPTRDRVTTRQGKWHIIEDEFIFVWAMNTAWAAYDMNVTPHAQLNDGAMDVLMMRKGTPRLEILQALLRCGKGEHLDLPHLEYYKVRAFRLEPLTKKGIFVVDGEPVDYSPIEMKVIRDLACVNC